MVTRSARPAPAPSTEPLAPAPLVGSQNLGLESVRSGSAVVGFGDRGPVVTDLQRTLGDLGYGVQATGLLGQTTQETLQRFQRDHGIAPTGALGATTLAGMERALTSSVTLAEFRAFAPQVDEKTAREWLPFLNASMAHADLDSDARKAAYLAQIAHETDGFATFEEYASGADYEGREDLGNTRAGDGVRYKGRGAIQLTGRTNYREIGQRLGVDFERHPELLERPEYAFLASADYWKRHDLNRLADRGDFEGITDVINRYDPEDRRRSRRARHDSAKEVLAREPGTGDRAPGTIGGPVPEQGGSSPRWADDPDRGPSADERTRFAGWFEDALAGHSLATRDAVAKDTAAHRVSVGLAPDGQDARTTAAGKLWQLTNAFSATHTLAAAGDRAGVMARAHQAAERARELRDQGLLPKDRAEAFLREMGVRYGEAKAGERSTGSAAARTPILDQHRMNHERSGAFCGIATLLATLEGNGKDPGVDTGDRDQLDRFARGIYQPGQGSSGAAMAARMREFGLKDAQFGTGGTIAGLTGDLAEGKPVPVGFVSMGGQVARLPQGSARYPGLREGDRHDHTFGASGHWATVVGFEGPAEAPTHFLVDDPDTGAQLRMTRAELERHTAAAQGIWNIGY